MLSATVYPEINERMSICTLISTHPHARDTVAPNGDEVAAHICH
jgi:hypothetical protein